MRKSIGVIDVGTNSVLALATNDAMEIFYDNYDISELGKGFYPSHFIRDDRMDILLSILKRFCEDMRQLKVQDIHIIGTSASRDAKNSDVLAKRIQDECNCPFYIISGELEAELSFQGASLILPEAYQNAYFLDIGGGSSECMLVKNGVLQNKTSLNVGIQRLSHRFSQKIILEMNEINSVREELQQLVFDFPLDPLCHKAVGIGGTFTTIASLLSGTSLSTQSSSMNRECSIEEIQQLFKQINSSPLERRLGLEGLDPKRAHIIHYGILIVSIIIEQLDIKSLLLNHYGLRHGAAINFLKNSRFLVDCKK